jgi:methyl-accepting chemotaxis protein
MGIRTKILFGFLILATMLFLAGAWSIYELRTVGTSVQRLLDDNYKSIHAARVMIEALEREDSAVLLLLSGNWKEGREIIESADSSFQQGFDISQNNVTIPGEKDYVDEIRKAYSAYKGLWVKPIVGTDKERNLNWYFKELHQSFLGVKLAVERLMDLNHQAMYQTATHLKNRAHRAVIPGVVAILAALVFTLIFNYLVSYYLVSPIIRITEGIQRFLQTNEPFQIKVETNDEMQRLATSLQELVTRYQKIKAV